jgi:serine/threonine-protein kinase
VVYEAAQWSTGRRVAIKVRREGFFSSPQEADRFRREVEVLKQIEHRNIVGIIDSGVQDGVGYYVMPFLEGLTLDKYVATHKPPIDRLMGMFEKIASAVNAAHLLGVIHRDLKPFNIVVDDRGEPHLLDFGLARLTEPLGTSTALQPGLTRTGHFVGSIPWASPEQAESKPSRVDLRTDIYSLGVLMFQMLTGKLPYEVENDLRQAAKTIARAAVASPSRVRADVPPEVDSIVLKCLRKDPGERYQSARELASDLRAYLDRPARRKPRTRLEKLIHERMPGRWGIFGIGVGVGIAVMGVLWMVVG